MCWVWAFVAFVAVRYRGARSRRGRGSEGVRGAVILDDREEKLSGDQALVRPRR